MKWPSRAVPLALALFAASSAALEPAELRIAACFSCHGADGLSAMPGVPSLGGQPSFFVVSQLFLFREGRRENIAMIEAAKGMSNDDMRKFSNLIAKLPSPAPAADTVDNSRFERGRKLSAEHRCGVCHGQDYSGAAQVPRLANQREDYLIKALKDFKSGARLGYGGAMADVLPGLGEGDLLDLAHFLAHQP